jgi:hypothetical protein
MKIQYLFRRNYSEYSTIRLLKFIDDQYLAVLSDPD